MVHFLRDESGQDSVEYLLLLAFLVLAAAALLLHTEKPPQIGKLHAK